MSCLCPCPCPTKPLSHRFFSEKIGHGHGYGQGVDSAPSDTVLRRRYNRAEMFNVLDVAFIGLAILFAIWNTVTLFRYASFRRLASTAELTWSPTRPWFYNVCLGIGFFMVSLTALSLFVLHRPMLATLAQALMALYYTVVFPLSFRIQRGFY